MPETLVIGLGGVGTEVCRRLAYRLAAYLQHGELPGAPQVLVLDTDEDVLERLPNHALRLEASAAMLDAVYRDPERFHAGWLNREVIRECPRLENGVRGRRMLGRLLLLLPENQERVRERLANWFAATPADVGSPRQVYLIAGAAGGTGGGILADMAYLVQEASAAAGAPVEVRGLLFVPPPDESTAAFNAFATLSELHYWADPATLYTACLGVDDAPTETRAAPFHRVELLTSVTAQNATIPLDELQERAAVYLLSTSLGDEGAWRQLRREQEAAVSPLDGDGNPQTFSTFGLEWVEYPEERLVEAVYDNLERRSLYGWLQGDTGIAFKEIPPNTLLLQANPVVRRLVGDGEGSVAQRALGDMANHIPRLYQAKPLRWTQLDREFEVSLGNSAGTRPGLGKPTKGPLVEGARVLWRETLGDLRKKTTGWLAGTGISLESVARVLDEAAAAVGTANDPSRTWTEALVSHRRAKQEALWSQERARRDPFMAPWRKSVLCALAGEYERTARLYASVFTQVCALPLLLEMRGQLAQALRAWSRRARALSGQLGTAAQEWAHREAAILERLREEEDAGRLALGRIQLPGAETPFLSHAGWNLPYVAGSEEAEAIEELRRGWIGRLVEAEGGLLAAPGQSRLDVDATQLRETVLRVNAELRRQVEGRLRAWLSSSAFQRLGEEHGSSIELEYRLQRLLDHSGQLPALEAINARPSGFAPEYQVVLYSDPSKPDLPPVLRRVVDAAGQSRPVGTRVLPSRSPHYLVAAAEHPGFSLVRCPTFYHLEERYEAARDRAAGSKPFPFNRADVPWTSATLVTRGRLREASDVLFLALALDLLRANPDGAFPIPGSMLPVDGRFPLPAEFDRAVRQLVGDLPALEAVGLAVDRTVQSRGVEWAALQVDRSLGGQHPLAIRFPDGQFATEAQNQRLAAIRAVQRYQDLIKEFARTATAADTEWLRADGIYRCPACGDTLGEAPSTLPGACPRCREPLLLPRLHGEAIADSFRRIPNPYVAGTPLETGANVFVGREDIIQQVRDRLIRPAQRTILILIGERRSGKTSALKQLQYRLEGDLTPLFVDMQGLTATDLPGFLWWLSWQMKETLAERGIAVNLPSYSEFTAGPPDFQFENVVLPEIQRKLRGGRILLMLDEFEVLAQRVMKGTFDSRAFDYLRHLMQHANGIEFLFAGTHVLRQFAANYVTFLFNIGLFLDVDFLTREDAIRLIREPVAAAGVTYSPESIDTILELTGSHPYFTQLFCFQLVERLNRLRKREVEAQDVEAESSAAIAAASAHLDHVWGSLVDSERLLISYFVENCPRAQRVREEDLLQKATQDDPELRPYRFRAAVDKLITVGLLRAAFEDDGQGHQVRTLGLTAEVYRTWLHQVHPYRRLKEEGLKWE